MLRLIAASTITDFTLNPPQYYVDAQDVEFDEYGAVQSFTMNGITFHDEVACAVANAAAVPHSGMILIPEHGVLALPPCSVLFYEAAVGQDLFGSVEVRMGLPSPPERFATRSERIPREMGVLLCQLMSTGTCEKMRSLARLLIALPASLPDFNITVDEWATVYNSDGDRIATPSMNVAALADLRPHVDDLGGEAGSPLSEFSDIDSALPS